MLPLKLLSLVTARFRVVAGSASAAMSRGPLSTAVEVVEEGVVVAMGVLALRRLEGWFCLVGVLTCLKRSMTDCRRIRPWLPVTSPALHLFSDAIGHGSFSLLLEHCRIDTGTSCPREE